MCAISIDVDEKLLRQANPNLDNIVAICQYYHRKECYHRYRRKSVSIIMKNDTNIKTYSPILQEAHDSITPQERASFDLNFSISERIYQILQEKGMTKRDLARLTSKKESEVSRWFAFGHNFTCKTIALIQLALGTSIIDVAQ